MYLEQATDNDCVGTIVDTPHTTVAKTGHTQKTRKSQGRIDRNVQPEKKGFQFFISAAANFLASL